MRHAELVEKLRRWVAVQERSYDAGAATGELPLVAAPRS